MAARWKVPSATSFLKGASSAAKARTRQHIQQREEAEPRILSPSDVQGNYDAARLLHTTIGGALRPITGRDLEAFAKNAKAIGKLFRGGITPQGVIDHSRPADRKRARDEIHYAVPSRNRAGAIQFVTNAGPDSDVHRHFVSVELVYFAAAVSSPRSPGQMADYLTRGKVNISCDCGRWKYWYNYLATIGKYNSGVPETGFPRIRNPELTGVACKHVLRTMVALRQGQVRNYIAKMVQQARNSVAAKTAAIAAAEAKAILQEQEKHPAKIATTREKQRTSKSAATLRKIARGIIEPHRGMNRTTAAKARAAVQFMLTQKVITKKQADALLSKIKGR